MALDLKLGPLKFVTIEGQPKETLGDALEAVGAIALPGERRPRPFAINLPVRGLPSDGAQILNVGDRLRRQVRALLENPKARAELLWLDFAIDPDLNAWLLAGGGDLSYTEQGTTFGDYLLELTDCYKVGDRTTHRPARRLEARDLRVSTAPRDTLGLIRSTDFAALSALARHWLPVGAVDLIGARGTVLPIGLAVPTADGTVQLVTGRANSDVIAYDQPAASEGRAGVVVRDRRAKFTDGYDADSRAAYGYDSGSAASVAVAGGRLSFVAAEPEAYHLTAGDFTDVEVIGQFSMGDLAGSPFVGWIIKRKANGDRLRIFALDGGGLFIQEHRAGADATLVSTGYAFAANTQYWLVARAVGDAVRLELWTNDPADGGTSVAATGVVLAGASQAAFGAGQAGKIGWYGRKDASSACYIESLRARALLPITTDPQDSGWDNVYGPAQQLTLPDVPVLENGRCRVRYDGTNTPGFRVDVWDGAAWAEQGKVKYYRVGDVGGECNQLVSATVVEWTPERAVLKAVMRNSADTYSREQVFITLQRGWPGPRFELYLAPKANGSAATSYFSYTPAQVDANDSLMKIDAAAAGAIVATAGTGALFAFGNVGAATFTGENWLAMLRQGQAYTAVMTVLQAGLNGDSSFDAGAYGGANRNQMLVTGGAGGYYSMHLGFHAQVSDQTLEGEAIRNASGTTSQVADAAASGGQAVEETQAAYANATLYKAAANLVPGAKYRIFVRARVVNGGATGSFQVGITPGSAGYGATVTTTSTTYVWLSTPELVAPVGGAALYVIGWRTAGTGALRIDRVEAIKVEDRTATVPAYDGARDLGQAVLMDSRQSQRLLPRAA